MPPDTVAVVSVNTGQPAPLGTWQGEEVWSAIHKHPVAAPSLHLDTVNLETDRQADLTVHGGPDKALYVYPLAHLEAWAETFGDGDLFVPGAIGDNLTVAGVTEADVCIGDVWRWGEALVQVAQPRQPCFKLALRTGRPDMTRRFERSGRCGWYLRVLTPARVPTTAPFEVEVSPDPRRLTVARAQRLTRRGGGTRDDVAVAAGHPALARSWRRALQHRLALADTAAP